MSIGIKVHCRPQVVLLQKVLDSFYHALSLHKSDQNQHTAAMSYLELYNPHILASIGLKIVYMVLQGDDLFPTQQLLSPQTQCYTSLLLFSWLMFRWAQPVLWYSMIKNSFDQMKLLIRSSHRPLSFERFDWHYRFTRNTNHSNYVTWGLSVTAKMNSMCNLKKIMK